MKCPLCNDGSIALFNETPQLNVQENGLLRSLPKAIEILTEEALRQRLTVREMLARTLTKPASTARRNAMIRLQNELNYTPKLISAVMQRDHSTVIQVMGNQRRKTR